MTIPTRRTIATATLGFAAGVNLLAVGEFLVQHHLREAGIQSLALVFLAGVNYVGEKATTILDTQLANWTAQRDTTLLIHAKLERQQAAFERHLDIEGHGGGRVQ
jgi:hypothetical protein